MTEQQEWPEIKPIEAGLRGRCPRCGEGHIFKGFLKMRPSCEACGLDYSFADPADGPAFFAMCFACIPSAAFAVWLEVAHSVPLWVHAVVSLPIMVTTCVLPMRPLKGWLVASQYHYKAFEARFSSERPE